MVPWLDYELRISEGVCQLVKADVRRPSGCSPSSMPCCSVNDRGLFNLYVKFDYAPEPLLAAKVLSRACLELHGLHFEVHDPLNYMSYEKLPFDMHETDLDNGLMLIRENIPKLTARVSEGMDVVVETF